MAEPRCMRPRQILNYVGSTQKAWNIECNSHLLVRFFYYLVNLALAYSNLNAP